MHFDQGFDDGKTQPCAALRTRVSIFGLPERLHNDGNLVGRNALAAVLDHNIYSARCLLNADIDDIAFTRELQSIGNEVYDDLFEPEFVPANKNIVITGSSQLFAGISIRTADNR